MTGSYGQGCFQNEALISLQLTDGWRQESKQALSAHNARPRPKSHKIIAADSTNFTQKLSLRIKCAVNCTKEVMVKRLPCGLEAVQSLVRDQGQSSQIYIFTQRSHNAAAIVWSIAHTMLLSFLCPWRWSCTASSALSHPNGHPLLPLSPQALPTG